MSNSATFIQIILLALALCVDSFVVSATSAFKSKMSYRHGFLMAFVFAFFQALFPLLGALLGVAFKEIIAAVDHWVAFGLLLLVGGKMILDAVRDVPDERQLDVSRFGVLCLLGIATSIDAFVVGIGLGLDNTMPVVWLTVIVVGVVTFLVSQLGLFLGKRNIPIPDKLATVLAGLVLIGLGTFTLVEHLSGQA